MSFASPAEPKELLAANDTVVHRHIVGPVMSVASIEREPVADSVRQNRRIIGIKVYWFDPMGCYCSVLLHSSTLRKATDAERLSGFTTAANLA